MKRSKHFRKDVIIARIIFLILCVALVIGIMWLVDYLKENPLEKEPASSQIESINSESGASESESIPDSEPEPTIPTEPETNTGTQTETEPESQVSTETESEETPKKLFVKTKARLKLRVEPNTTCDVILIIDTNKEAEVIEELDGWFKVLYKGHEGYVSADYVKLVEHE